MVNSRPIWATKSGRATPDEKDRIAELAERGWPLMRTARALERHPSFVLYYYTEMGYRPVKLTAVGGTYTRNGKPVRRFSADEDAKLLTLRCAGKTLTEIGRETGRSINSVRARLNSLAASD